MKEHLARFLTACYVKHQSVFVFMKTTSKVVTLKSGAAPLDLQLFSDFPGSTSATLTIVTNI